jgi:hypothetical protein
LGGNYLIAGLMFGFLQIEDQEWLQIAIIFLFVMPLSMGHLEHGFQALRLAAIFLVQIGGIVSAFTLINSVVRALLSGPA